MPRLQSAVAGALVGAASAYVPGPAAIAVGGAAQGGVNFGLDRFEAVPSFRWTPTPLLAGVAQGAAAGVAAWLAGPVAGAVVGGALGALRLGLRPDAERAGNAVGLESMGVPALWRQGLTGAGVGVAVLDSGCAAHPALGDRLVAFHDTVEGKTEAYDVDVHGTAVSTLIAGAGQGASSGVAPEAHIVAVRVADSERAVDSAQVLQGLQWVQANRQRYNIQVVNMSFGLNDPGMSGVVQKVQELSDQGMIVVTSAGNTGPEPRRPNLFKASPDLLTVGATDTRGTRGHKDDRLSSSSARAQSGSSKGADFVAPCDNLIAGQPSGMYMHFQDGQTSLAGALASGVLALWKQAKPNLTLAQAQAAIQATAVPLRGEDPLAQGAGLIQAEAGLAYLRHGK
jgi:hypothetical protein